MMDRIMKVFTFKQEVYKEVEGDVSFTPTAWMIVAVVAFLSQMGANASRVSEGGNWVLGTISGTVFAVAGFAVGAFIISWVGKNLFNADVTFEEMVRTLGLAYVWNIIGFFGIIGLVLPALVCMVSPLLIAASIAGLLSWFIAAKEALDLEWPQTIGTVLIGWIAAMILSMIVRFIF